MPLRRRVLGGSFGALGTRSCCTGGAGRRISVGLPLLGRRELDMFRREGGGERDGREGSQAGGAVCTLRMPRAHVSMRGVSGSVPALHDSSAIEGSPSSRQIV
jgi:hypothetical protein